MIGGLSSLLFIPLLAVTLVRLLWVFGATWPAANEALLAQTVRPLPDARHMPPRLITLLVALGAFAAGLLALAMSDPAPNATMTVLGALLTAGFATRGVLGLTDWWRRRSPHEPYARLNRRFYAPLYLFLAAGFGALTLWRVF